MLIGLVQTSASLSTAVFAEQSNWDTVKQKSGETWHAAKEESHSYWMSAREESHKVWSDASDYSHRQWKKAKSASALDRDASKKKQMRLNRISQTNPSIFKDIRL